MTAPVPTTRFDARLRRVAFGFLALTICAAELLVAHSSAFAAYTDLLTRAILFDLLVFVPGLAYLMVVRPGGQKARRVVPVFLLGVTVAVLILPGLSRATFMMLRLLALPLEVMSVVWLTGRVRRGLRASAGTTPEVQIEHVAAAMLGGPSWASTALASEIAVFYYAFAGPRLPTPSGTHRFSVTESSGWVGLAGGLAVVSGFEALAGHLLLARWSVLGAWIATLLSVYGALWLLADAQACRLHPVTLTEDENEGLVLQIRTGLRGRVMIPVREIADVRRVLSHPPRRRPRAYVNLTVFGAPQFRLHLSSPVMVEGPFGLRRDALFVAFAVDDPAAFAAALTLASPEA